MNARSFWRSDEVLVCTASCIAVQKKSTPFLSARAERNRVEPERKSTPKGDFDFPLWKPLKTTKRAPALLDFPARRTTVKRFEVRYATHPHVRSSVLHKPAGNAMHIYVRCVSGISASYLRTSALGGANSPLSPTANPAQRFAVGKEERGSGYGDGALARRRNGARPF